MLNGPGVTICTDNVFLVDDTEACRQVAEDNRKDNRSWTEAQPEEVPVWTVSSKLSEF